jgi:hypothetical protein
MEPAIRNGLQNKDYDVRKKTALAFEPAREFQVVHGSSVKAGRGFADPAEYLPDRATASP